MPDTDELLQMNRAVFAERDPQKRRAAIERTYSEDVRFVDADADVMGHEALNDRAQKILDDAPADFVLEADGPAYASPDTGAQAWRFGPPGSPVVHGIDILTVRDGTVSTVRTLVGSQAES